MFQRMMAARFAVALFAAALLGTPTAVSSALAGDLTTVNAVEDVAKLDEGTTAVRVRGVSAEKVEALAKRLPGITKLVLYEPSNKIELRALEALARFPRLSDLTFGGDPFLYEKEFAALGRLRQLRHLRLALI